MDLLATIPLLVIFTGIGLSYTRIIPAIAGFILSVLGVLTGLGCSITLLLTGASWGLAGMAALPFIVAVPMALNGLRYPVLNDVTTDPENPPAFEAAAQARPNQNRDMSYPESFGPIIRKAYPDVRPLVVDESPNDLFRRVEKFAKNQPGWEMTDRDPKNRTMECEVTSSVFRFVDDLVIRVSNQDTRTRLDLRSKSRDGLGDLGANAKRIERFLRQLVSDPGHPGQSSKIKSS